MESATTLHERLQRWNSLPGAEAAGMVATEDLRELVSMPADADQVVSLYLSADRKDRSRIHSRA
jgi:hypothetical protein